MKKQDFYYDLPEALIAQHPSKHRDHSRLLCYNPQTKDLWHRHFYEITGELKAGDVLVLNDSKVIPARLFGQKEGMQKLVELLLLRRIEGDEWACLAKPGRKLTPGTRLRFGEDGRFFAEVIGNLNDGQKHVRFEYEGIWEERLDELGQMPLPPYIHEQLEDPSRYQTVYAKDPGSAAAPTAGLHFTEALLSELKARGVEILYVTLHVGLGTFRPVKEERIEDHPMHSEYFILTQPVADAINRAKAEGRRVIAVGTTACRVLETAAQKCEALAQEKLLGKAPSHRELKLTAMSGDTNIFIYPGYSFRVLDGLITNFHLPESTLVMLVSALVGRDEILSIYRKAVERAYRFFSFGDAMFLQKASPVPDFHEGPYREVELIEHFSEQFDQDERKEGR